MILTYRSFGRLGNRLFILAHLLAFAQRYSVSLVDYAFRKYGRNFPFWRGRVPCSYDPHGAGIPAFFRSPAGAVAASAIGAIPTVRFWDERDIIFDGEDVNDPRVRQLASSKAIVFEGWRLRSREQIKASRPEILSAFEPALDIRQRVLANLCSARQRGDRVLGVHIRWEDYRGTDRFFALEEYCRSIDSVRSSLKPEKVSCIACSPEPIDRDQLPADCLLLERSSAVVDLYSLAGCDYIMGPPSTFSGWASFYGGKPLIVMRNHEKLFSVHDAEIVLF